jgi:outer membrane protein
MNTHSQDFNAKPLRLITLISILLLVFSGSIYAQKQWTLEECINHALEHNIRIKQSVLEVESGEINLLESKLNMLPSLNAGASHSFGWGRSVDMATYQYVDQQTQQSYFNMSSEFTLFSGMQKHNTMKQRRADYMTSKYNADKMRNDISLTVAGYYLQILFSQELLNNARNQLDVTQQQIARTQRLVEAGTLPRGSLLEIQAQGASEEVNLVNAENQLNLAYLDLLQLLELPASTEFDIDVPELSVKESPQLLPVQTIYNTALDVMPEIKSAEYNVLSSEHALADAKGARLPSLGMSAAIGTNYSDQIRLSNNPLDPAFNEIKTFNDQWKDNRSTTLSIRLNIPIFNGYQISSYVNRSKLGLMNADYNLELSRNNLRKDVETAYADAVAAYAAFNARQKSLNSLQEAFKYTEERFNVGMVNAIDYNVGKNQLSRAESDLLSGKYDYIFKLKVLDFYLGRSLTLADMQDFMED